MEWETGRVAPGDCSPQREVFFTSSLSSSQAGGATKLDVAICFAPLLAWILQGWRSTRWAVALDATSLGDRFTVLSIGIVYRGEAIPVAWKVLHANVPRPWKPEWIALLRVFAELVCRQPSIYG